MPTVVITALLVAVVSADTIPHFVVPGKCANVLVQDNFDLHKVHFISYISLVQTYSTFSIWINILL